MNTRLVVFDPGIEAWLDNRILDETFAREWPGGLWLSQLSNLAMSKGILMETIDHFKSRKYDSHVPICLMIMANRISPATRELISSNQAYGGVCICLESPLIAYDFYHKLAMYSTWFRHIFAFSGAGARVNVDTVFHPIVWPYEENQVILGRPWAERKLLTLINSNRRAMQNVIPNMDIRHPRSSLNLFLEYFRVHQQLKNDPWLRSELYLERLRAIEYFSNNPMFDLYGRGWNK